MSVTWFEPFRSDRVLFGWLHRCYGSGFEPFRDPRILAYCLQDGGQLGVGRHVQLFAVLSESFKFLYAAIKLDVAPHQLKNDKT